MTIQNPELSAREWSILAYLCENVIKYRNSRTIGENFALEVGVLRTKLEVGDPGSLTHREWWMLLYFCANAHKTWKMPKGNFYWKDVESLKDKLYPRGTVRV